MKATEAAPLPTLVCPLTNQECGSDQHACRVGGCDLWWLSKGEQQQLPNGELL